MDAIMPGMTPGEEIDVVVSIDMSGSISNKQAQQFLGEIGGMMDAFDGYKVHVFCFDTDTYNPQDFSSENMETIEEAYKKEKKTVRDLNEIIFHLRMEIKRLHEILNESKH